MRNKAKKHRGNGAKLRRPVALKTMHNTGLRRQESPTMRTSKEGLRPTRTTMRTRKKA